MRDVPKPYRERTVKVKDRLPDPHPMGEWADSAACIGTDPDIFFPRIGVPPTEALAYCAVCSVRKECLEDALTMPAYSDQGIRGGKRKRERDRLRKERKGKDV